MRSSITNYIKEHQRVTEIVLSTLTDSISDVAKIIYKQISHGGKLMICGNGGSASDAQHIAAEFVNRFRRERSPLPAISLTTDTSVITSISNDYSFDKIFSKQIEALANPNDILLAISTSGTSPNITQALIAAKEKQCVTISLTGKTGGDMLALSDMAIVIPSDSTPIIQEMHLMIEHLICDLVEQMHVCHSKPAGT